MSMHGLDAHQGNETAKRLTRDDKEGKVPKEFFSHYTIITADKFGSYKQAAYAAFFPQEIGAIVAIFDDWISGWAVHSLHLFPWLSSLIFGRLAKAACRHPLHDSAGCTGELGHVTSHDTCMP